MRRSAWCVLAAACGLGLMGNVWSPKTSSPSARWRPFLHVPAVVDLSAPRADGALTVAAAGRLATLRVGARPRPFARHTGGYMTARGPEPYLTLAAPAAVPGAGCSFRRDDVYAIEPGGRPGVITVNGRGQARRLADVTPGIPTGIAFDGVGRFGHRLLVTAALPTGSAIFAVDCAGHVTVVTQHAPRVEGGAVVAPRSFGPFAGDLIAPDEQSGRVVAIDPEGNARTLVDSGLPSGGDIGVESAGFVPATVRRGASAYLADRGGQAKPHPGTDSILRLSAKDLLAAGVRPGDLLVASEGGAETIAVRCAATCSVRHIADGPSATHAEGHIVFARAG